jgi:hypothetical protein
LGFWLGGCSRLRIRELHARIRRNDIRHTACDQQQGIVVVSAAHERDGFALKTPNFAVGQNRFQAVSDLDASTVIFYCVHNQHATVCGFGAHAPFLEKVNRVTLYVGPIKGINCYHSHLCVSLLVDLPSDVSDLRDRGLIKNVREIIDVSRGLKL